MKKFNLIIFSILGFTISCNSDDDNNNPLIGKWYIESSHSYQGKGIIDMNNPLDDPHPEKSRIIFQENDSILRDDRILVGTQIVNTGGFLGKYRYIPSSKQIEFIYNGATIHILNNVNIENGKLSFTENIDDDIFDDILLTYFKY